MTRPGVGDKAPLFKLPNQDGVMTDLADSLGQLVVIYFYPKALTSGCTVQACDLRDSWKVLQKQGIRVYGISPDQPKLLKNFQEVEQLPFDLLSDNDHKVAELYGTWQEKSMYGRKYMGMARDSFLIGRDGTVISVLQKVKPAEHVGQIIEAFSLYGG
ncbi:MAG: thioredoxin-dependent thiol peroxidase [Alphaproteobacteria bacterium]|nr:MAG: thioredoxin-dependent thiol peroxidase [Alphaproteobacteria bacterium]